jgi:hypothetical protein
MALLLFATSVFLAHEMIIDLQSTSLDRRSKNNPRSPGYYSGIGTLQHGKGERGVKSL